MKFQLYVPVLLLINLTILASTGVGQQKQKPGVYLTAEEGGFDFQAQGEYEGTIGERGKFGVQVVALGDNKFDLYFLQGGLPGAGWDGKVRLRVPGDRDGMKVKFGSKGYRGEILEGQIKGGTEADEKFAFKKVERKSKTLGLQPPKDAVVLFDGKSADEWKNGKLVEGKYLNWGVSSKKSFSTGKYHIEFRTPFQPKARGQGRGNSGVYLMGREIQVLDSFGLTGANNECGGFYGNAKPAVNMCLPPLSWQTFDVEITAGPNGNALATVWHNGVKIHENFDLGRKANQAATINLQNHGNPVYYQNIWVVPGK